MSLYYEAAAILTANSREGSLKSRIYANTPTGKSKPAQIYALISETAKYDAFLKEVIDKSELLNHESKLTPLLSLLLVHDFLFTKRGISAPSGHPLRLAIERHKARLQAECTKARIARKCATIDALKLNSSVKTNGVAAPHPRWIRVNTLKTTLQEQVATTFAGYEADASIQDVGKSPGTTKTLCQDKNIPDVLCVPPDMNFARLSAYNNGSLILQDKASCFPAYLLLGDKGHHGGHIGDIIDGCAAPGNKTTHLAAMLKGSLQSSTRTSKAQIFACERDARRSVILQNMVNNAGADSVVILAKQDFLALDPHDSRFANVTHLLLDPSCSGSGIVSREDVPVLKLPLNPREAISPETYRKKRRRVDEDVEALPPSPVTTNDINAMEEAKDTVVDEIRLQKLSNLQSRIVEHAFAFPAATKITYSTCSLHVHENEAVVDRVLRSEISRRRGWNIMERKMQPPGLCNWVYRGMSLDGTGMQVESETGHQAPAGNHELTPAQVDACIRCNPNDGEGTMGFFVCGFVRNGIEAATSNGHSSQHPSDVQTSVDKEDNEWHGFSDSE